MSLRLQATGNGGGINFTLFCHLTHDWATAASNWLNQHSRSQEANIWNLSVRNKMNDIFSGVLACTCTYKSPWGQVMNKFNEQQEAEGSDFEPFGSTPAKGPRKEAGTEMPQRHSLFRALLVHWRIRNTLYYAPWGPRCCRHTRPAGSAEQVGWQSVLSRSPLPMTERSNPGSWEFHPALPLGNHSPPGLFLLSVTPRMVQTSGQAAKGNRKEERRNWRRQYCKQSSDEGGRGQKNQTPLLLSDRRAQRYRMNLWKYAEVGTENTQRGRGQGRNKEREAPANSLAAALPLPRHWAHCLQRLLSCGFPEPPPAQTVLVPNRKVTDVSPVRRAGLHRGLHQLLYFYSCRVQGFHCKGLTDWSTSWPHLTQFGSLSQRMFIFRDWYVLKETIPLQMQPNTWRCKANSHMYPWLGTASGSSLCILTMGPIRDAGCWKNSNSLLERTHYIPFRP